MQYILTEEEYRGLVRVEDQKKRDEALDLARRIIVHLSGVKCGQEYCSGCPVSSIQHEKEINGLVPNFEESAIMCHRTRRYGK